MNRIRNGRRVTIGVVAIFLFGQALVAQQPAVKRDAPRSVGVLVRTDVEVDAALAEAKKALDQNRLTDAVNIYQTLIEQSGDLLYAIEPNLYVPVAVVARNALRQLPPSAVEYYRQTYEPLAAAKWEEAQKTFDALALRAIAVRWPLTEAAA